MESQELNLECDQCGMLNKRSIQLIRPEAFTNRRKPLMLTQYWCPKCREPQAFRIKFKRDKKKNIIAEVKHRVDPTSLLIPKATPTGITIRPKQKSYKR